MDNTAQVVISNPNRAGTYTVTVSRHGAHTTNAQPYALVTTGAAGVVSRVEFFSGWTSLGVDTSAPYFIAWKPAAAGNYILTARATDSQGAVGTSPSVTAVALLPAPTISSLSPASGPVGTSVLINGTNLSAATGVQFNGVASSVWRFVSATQTSATAFTVTTPPAAVVISQIYAGGGRRWSGYSKDYVELHNPGTAPVQIDGWSLQLTGGTGT